MRTMKTRSLVLLMILVTAGLSSCGVTEPTPDAGSTVKSYFYPLKNGWTYTYTHITQNTASPSYDTATYQINVALTPTDTNKLVSVNMLRGVYSTLYAFTFSTDAQGIQTALLADATHSFVALRGEMTDSSSWVCDPATATTAKVIAHYDQYDPQHGDGHIFQDVIVIQYHRAGDPVDTYILRFFARGFGLITEKSIIGNSTVIGTLQLLSVDASKAHRSATNDPGVFNRYLDRPMVNFRLDDK
jgi:hypothetical protein